MKKRIFNLVEKGSQGNKINLIFDYVIMSLIFLSIVSIILESIKEISADFKLFLKWFDLFSISVFTIEYILRIYIADLTHPSKSKLKSILKFVFSTNGLIDLFAILPFYIPMIIKIDLRFLRTIRLIRFLRILKVNRYTKSLNLIWSVIKDKKSELAVTGFVTLLLLIFSSFIMYNVEGEIQPNAFSNILSAFWWAVATLTTVGYGDVYPVTGIGKFISGLIALMGIGLVALPTGILGSGFMDKIKNENKTCPHCGKNIEN